VGCAGAASRCGALHAREKANRIQVMLRQQNPPRNEAEAQFSMGQETCQQLL
jgi:hypothetical protein